MPVEILMPALSPTMTHGSIAKWLKQPGDNVRPGDVIAEIETDKAIMELESADAGIFGVAVVAQGTKDVPVNKLIGLLLQSGESIDSVRNYTQDILPKVFVSDEVAQNKLDEHKCSPHVAPTYQSKTSGNKVFASPLAKNIAALHDIPLSSIDGTGPYGRIIKRDVQAFANQSVANNANKQTQALSNNKHQEYLPPTLSGLGQCIIPHTSMRRTIAQRLTEAKQQIPHFYLKVTANVDNLLNLRRDINADCDLKLSLNDFIIRAVALSLGKHDCINSSWSADGIVQHKSVDVCVAVAVPGGLVTPIIKNTDTLSVFAISKAVRDLAARAKDFRLKPFEYEGGTFTISNLGMYDVDEFYAIINPPQACILSVGAARKVPAIVGESVTAANVVTFGLACDHRVVDGVGGAKFLQTLKRYIEKPLNMMV